MRRGKWIVRRGSAGMAGRSPALAPKARPAGAMRGQPRRLKVQRVSTGQAVLPCAGNLPAAWLPWIEPIGCWKSASGSPANTVRPYSASTRRKLSVLPIAGSASPLRPRRRKTQARSNGPRWPGSILPCSGTAAPARMMLRSLSGFNEKSVITRVSIQFHVSQSGLGAWQHPVRPVFRCLALEPRRFKGDVTGCA